MIQKALQYSKLLQNEPKSINYQFSSKAEGDLIGRDL